MSDTVTDVVCGMVKPISEMKFYSDYRGKRFYFCSEVDKDLFDANPDNWIKKGGE
jgi:YHS domain-containing protein